MPSTAIIKYAARITALAVVVLVASESRAQSGSMRVSLPSPSAAALGKFGDVPVSIATGTPEVSIPIFTLRGKTLQVPVSLRYHASGLRVEEIGGWAGMGWALEAGGSITRTVRGIADEKAAGYWFTGHRWWSPSSWPTPTVTDLFEIENESLDPEPDQFFFNFAGRSGQFVMGPTNASPTSQMVRAIPYQRLRIVPDNPAALNSWEITTEDGTKYTFAQAEITTDFTTTSGGGQIPAHYGDAFITSWHLTKIRAPGGDSVTFHYGAGGGTHNLRSYREKFDQVIDPNPPACVSGAFDVLGSYQISGFLPDSIKGATHTIRFLRGSTLRSDALSPTGQPQESRLDKILVTTPSGAVLREFQLEHNYSAIEGRLTLVSVTEKDRSGNQLPPTVLAYQPGAFPARSSSAQDHYGYFNGKTLQTDLIPGALTPSGLWLPGADRDPDLVSARIGSLTRITYATGGYNEFVYELNDYGGVAGSATSPSAFGPPQSQNAVAGFNDGSVTSQFTIGGSASVPVTITVDLDPACGPQIGCPYAEIVGAAMFITPGTYSVTLAPGTYTLHAAEEMIGGLSVISVSWRDWIVQPKKPAGGLRLAELRTVDAMGQSSIRKYRYVIPTDTMRSSGVVSQEPRYDYTVNTVGCAYFSRSSTSKTPLGSGPVVAYRAVTVLYGTNGEFGRDVHRFRSPYEASDQPVTESQWPGARATSNEWMRGQAISTTVSSATNVQQSRTAQAWTFISDTLSQPLAVERFRAISLNSFASGVGSMTAHNAFEVVAGWAFMSSDTTVAYDESGANAITTTRDYRYENAAHGMLSRISETAPGGTRRITRMRYPADFALGAGDPEATALGVMNGTAHIPGAVIERVVEDSTGTVRVLQAEVTTFRTTALGRTLPYQTFAFDAPAPATGFVNAAVTGGLFTKDSRFVLQETVTSYDSAGRVLQLSDAGSHLTTHEYGGNANAAFLTKVTRVKDAAGLADLVTMLGYNADGFHTSTTDEGGRIERFAYDLFGRLTERRNHDSVLVASYAYAYSRTSANGWTFSAATPNVVTSTMWIQQTPTPRSIVSQEWLDGLGRPIQSVVQGGSTYFVTATQYDLMGRVWRTWKPYSRASAGFDAAFTATATTFYNTYHSTGNAKPYDETGYATDASSRVTRETPAYIGTSATIFRTTTYGTDVATQQRYAERADELNKRIRAYIDVLGSPARSVLGFASPEITSTTLVYDAAGRRTQTIDPRGNFTTHGLSTRGLALTSASADAGVVTREFDRSGKLRYSQDENQANAGNVMFMTYDFADRALLTGVGTASLGSLDPDAVSPPSLETTQSNWLTVNAFDAKPSTAAFPWSVFAAQINPLTLQRTAGRVAAEAHRSNGAWQVTLFSYDTEGRVATRHQFTQHMSGVGVSATLNTIATYTYDLRGALSQRALTVGAQSFWQWTDYDDRGLLWKVFAATSAVKPGTSDVTFTYRPSGEIEQRTFSGGPAVQFRYTIREQLERIGDPASTSFPFSARYAYHANGTVHETEFYQAGTPATAKRYRYVVSTANYDALNRLKAADFSPWSGSTWTSTLAHDLTSIAYDAAGNLTGLRRYRAAATLVDQLTYQYVSGNQLSTLTDAIAPTTETWDAESGGFTYDANGNLLTAPGPYGLTAATYDAWNRVLSATTAAGTTQYRLTASGHQLAQQTGMGSTDVTIREGATVLGGVTLNAGGAPTAWHFNLLAGDRAIGRLPHTGSRRYYHADLLGNVRAVVTGMTVVEAADYDPWGVVLAGRSLGSGTKEGFTSKPRDTAIGWDDFGARQYLAAYGRWASTDPIGAGTPEWSPYTYTRNNPVLRIDPFGLCEPWPRCVNDYWENVAVAGHLRGGIRGTAKAVAATAMSTLVEYSGVNQADQGLDRMAGGQPVLGAAMVGLAIVGNLPGGRAVGKVDDVAEAIDDAAKLISGGGDDFVRVTIEVGKDAADGLPNSAMVARGGDAANHSAARIEAAIGPSRTPGVSGFSAQCNGGTCISDLGAFIRNRKMGITTVGQIRAIGGDVIATPGIGHHVTVTGVSGEAVSSLFQIVTNPNPLKAP